MSTENAVFAPFILVLSAFVNVALSLPVLLLIAFMFGTHPN